MEQAKTVLETIALTIDLVGIAILVYAALKFIVHFLGFEIKRLRGLECVEGIRDMRLRLGIPSVARWASVTCDARRV